MVTRRKFSPQEIRKNSSYFSPLKTIVETAFYENQVQSIKTVEEAYQLASAAAGTVVLDMPVIHTKELGLPLCTGFTDEFRSGRWTNGKG